MAPQRACFGSNIGGDSGIVFPVTPKNSDNAIIDRLVCRCFELMQITDPRGKLLDFSSLTSSTYDFVCLVTP